MSTSPSFAGIGMMKAGTTLVHQLLERHPGAAVPRWNKEVSFYDLHFDRGFSWYREHFTEDAIDAGAVWGDLTPGYVLSDAARANLASLPEVPRLLVCLRDPVARLRSQYHHDQATLGVTSTFSDYVEADTNQVVTRSCYGRLLRPWIAEFGLDRFHFFMLEDYQADQDTVAYELFTALGLPPLSNETLADVGRVNEAVVARSPRLAAVAHRTQVALRGAGLFPLAARLASNDVFRSAVFRNERPEPESAPVPPTVLDRLSDDRLEFSQLTGLGTERWSAVDVDAQPGQSR